MKDDTMTQQKATTWQPTSKQIKFKDAYFDLVELKNISECCKEAGVARSTYYRDWLKIPDFNDWFNEQRVEVARTWAGKIDLSLIKKCLKGDVNGIRLFYEKFDSLTQRLEVVHKNEDEDKQPNELEQEINDLHAEAYAIANQNGDKKKKEDTG